MSTKIARIIEEIKGLSIMEAAELVKEMETTFGVSAAAPIAAAGASPAAAAPAEEKNEFKVTLKDAGANKIGVIKALREAATALGKSIGLKEAKDFVEGAPSVIFESEPKANAQKMKETLEAAGAKVELS